MKKIISLLIALTLICLFGCSPTQENEKTSTDIQNDEENITSKVSYQTVVDLIETKLGQIEQETDTALWAYCDINNDGSEELFLLYEYPEVHLTYEIWTLLDGSAVQIAADSDFASLAGEGLGGINLVKYDDNDYLCFWYRNSEADPPGTDVSFSFSLWRLTEEGLKDPQRLDFTYHTVEDGVVNEVISSYGAELSIDECENIIDAFYNEPVQKICQMRGGNSSGIGISLNSFDEGR